MAARTTPWYWARPPWSLTNGSDHSQPYRPAASSSTAARNTSSSMCRGSAQASAAARRTGSPSHFRKRSTAVAPGARASPGFSASVDTRTGSRPESRSTSRTTSSSTTPLVASSWRASVSVNRSSGSSATRSAQSAQQPGSRRRWPARTTTTWAGSAPYRSVVSRSRSQVSRNGEVRSYVSKKSTVHGTSSAIRTSSATRTGVRTCTGSRTSWTSSCLPNRALRAARIRSAPRASCWASIPPHEHAHAGHQAEADQGRLGECGGAGRGGAGRVGGRGGGLRLVPPLAVGGKQAFQGLERVALAGEVRTERGERLGDAVDGLVRVGRQRAALARGVLQLAHERRLADPGGAVDVEDEPVPFVVDRGVEVLPEQREFAPPPDEPGPSAPPDEFLHRRCARCHGISMRSHGAP